MTQLEAHHKKILVLASLMIMGVFMIASVSAFEFDNVKSYDPLTKTATAKNSFLGIPTSKVSEITLLTPSHNYVPQGYGEVARFRVKSFEDYSTAFKKFEMYNKKLGDKEISRSIDYKVLGYEEVDVDDYSQDCKIKDAKADVYDCTTTKSGSHRETIEKWTTLGDYNFKNGDDLTIGVFTNVQMGDLVEWVPNFFGIRINEWAVWDTNLNVNVPIYYKLNETSGTTAWNIPQPETNMSGMNGQWGLAGIINGSYAPNNNGADTNFYMKNLDSSTNTWAITFWVKRNGTIGGFPSWFGSATGSIDADGEMKAYSNGDDMEVYQYKSGLIASGSSGTIPLNTWSLIVAQNNATHVQIFVNGALTTALASGYDPDDGTFNLTFFSSPSGSNKIGNVIIDEIGVFNRSLTNAEITNLYNAGAGVTYGTITTGSVTINLDSPPNNFGTTQTSINLTANVSSTLYNLSSVNVYVYNNSKALIYNNNISVNQPQYNATWNLSTISEGVYNWSVYAINSNGDFALSSNRTFFIDATPPSISITYPLNGSSIVTTNNQVNVSFNATIIDNLALNTCWYFNETANVTLANCGTNATISFGEGYHTIVRYANDTAGNFAQNATTFFINYLRSNAGYANTTIESANTTIYFNITATSLGNSSVVIKYNNTDANMSLISTNSTASLYSYNFFAPVVSADTYVNFSFNYSLNNYNFQTANSSQLVYNIPNLVVSGSACNTTAISFALQDEVNFTSLSGTYQYNFAYGTSANSTFSRVNGTITGSPTLNVCFNQTIAPNWTLGDGQIFYTATGYENRRYYLFTGQTLTNATNSITLFDLFSSDATTFKLTIDQTYLIPYANKFSTLVRWYPQLYAYNVVDMGLTDNKGETAIHVKTNDVDYRIGVYEQNGSLIYLASPIRMVCLTSPCEYNLKVPQSTSDFTSFEGIQFNFDYNYTTNIWTFTFSDPSQRTSLMNMTIYSMSGSSVYPVCANTLSATSGAMTCNTSAYSGNFRGIVERSASPPIPITSLSIDSTSNAFSSSFGLILSMIIAIPIAFIFAMVSPIGAVLGAIIALIPALYLGSINWAIMGGIAVLGGLIVHFMKRT